MTTTELETLSPPIGARCTDVLSDTLEGYAGIESVEFDLESGQLKEEDIKYDLERIQNIFEKSGQNSVVKGVIENMKKKKEQEEEEKKA